MDRSDEQSLSMSKAAEIGQQVIDAKPRRKINDIEARTILALASVHAMAGNDGDLREAALKLVVIDLKRDVPFYDIIEKRLQLGNTDVESGVILMASISSDRPGMAVMYAAAIRCIFEKNGRRVTVLDYLNAFVDSFPTTEALHDVWNGQKRNERKQGETDNVLDTDVWS